MPSSSRRSKLSAEKFALLEKRLRGETGDPATGTIVARSDRTAPFPVSFAQRRLWFLDQLMPHRGGYNIAIGLRLTGHLNAAALERSLDFIVERHEIMRTSFASHDGQPFQIVLPHARTRLLTEDLSALDETARESELARLATDEAGTAFDLERGPLYRFKLLRLSDEAHALLLTMHHIIADGWSISVLARELTTLYNALSANRPARLPDLPVQYADYAAWQRHHLTDAILERQLAYWRKQLGGTLPLLELPTDRQRKAVQSHAGERYRLSLSPRLTDQLKALSRQEGTTLFMSLLAAFKVLLFRYTRQEDIPVGTPIATRDSTEIEALIGLFLNMLTLRTHLRGGTSFRQTLRQVKETALSAYEHKDVPFEKLIEDLHPGRSLSHTPLFQVTFQFQDASQETFALAGLQTTALSNQFEAAKFDLTLAMFEVGGVLTGLFRYNKDLFAEATIRRLSSHFEILLEDIVARPDEPIAALLMSSNEERVQLVASFNERLE